MDEFSSPRITMQKRKMLSEYKSSDTTVCESPSGSPFESTRVVSPQHISIKEPDISKVTSPGSPVFQDYTKKLDSGVCKEKLSKSACSVRERKSSLTSRQNKSCATIAHNQSAVSDEDDQPSGETKPLQKYGTRSGKNYRSSEDNPVKLKASKPDDNVNLNGTRLVSWMIVILFVMIGVAIGGCLLSFENRSRGVADWVREKRAFKSDLESLQKRFSKQNRHFYRTVQPALLTGMQVDPAQPGVLVLLSSAEARDTAACLLYKLVDLLVPRFTTTDRIPGPSDVVVNSSHVEGRDSFQRTLDERLSTFSVAGIFHLQKLSKEIAMVLHGLADDRNAPYKNSVLLMTLESEISVSDCNPDQFAEDFLNKHWKIDGDETSLTSRVTNAVVQVLPESSQTIKLECPNLS